MRSSSSSVTSRASSELWTTVGVSSTRSSVRTTLSVVLLASAPRMGMSERSGTPLRALFFVSWIRPPSASVPPFGTDTTVLSRRWEIVGALSVEVVVVIGVLTSCSISSVATPFALTRGVTRMITPVLIYVMLFTSGAPAVIVLTACARGTGTSSPTWRTAVWWSSTIRWGAETMLTLVMVDSALSTACALLLPNTALKPGNVDASAPVGDVLSVACMPCSLKNHCRP
jgi:hypothetical protein